jgi:GTP-dependent phosphoenolpyruvate carboxykinase
MGYNMSDATANWLDLGGEASGFRRHAAKSTPQLVHQEDDGKFVWPGWREHARAGMDDRPH